MGANVYLKPSLTLTIPNSSVSIDLDPGTNAFGTEDISITVGTNNSNGYRLYVSTSDSSTRLVNTVDSSEYIDTLPSTGDNDCSSGCSESAFPVNYWGYKLNSGNYLPFTSGAMVSSSNGPVNDNHTTMTIGAKVDYTKSSGTYLTNLQFNVIPQVSQHYMQEFTNPTIASEVCTNIPTIVIDSRDEHPYTVQRLADGHCWMLDNLDLDLTNRTIVDGLTTDNTNINTTADPYALESLRNGYRNGAACTSIDCSKYATDGLEYHNWTVDSTFSRPKVNRSGMCNPNKNSRIPCVGVWQGADYTHNTILDKVDSVNMVVKDNANNVGGPGGYRIGTYYNYCAVSAGTYCYGDGGSTGTPSGDAVSDICPAGWHMPSDNGGNNGDYLTLCSAIKGGAVGCTGSGWNDMSITATTSMQYQLSLSLYGFYNNSTVYARGEYGFFWSSTSYDDAYMRRMYVSSSALRPQHFTNRFDGNSVRCVSS